MKTIVFLNNKGGVGKTASTTTIVHMMATKFNKKVLLIDLDPQMNSSVMFSEIDFVSIFESVYLGKRILQRKELKSFLKMIAQTFMIALFTLLMKI